VASGVASLVASGVASLVASGAAASQLFGEAIRVKPDSSLSLAPVATPDKTLHTRCLQACALATNALSYLCISHQVAHSYLCI